MNLESYISQLLYRYQCVTVPGFGAFLTENQSAQHIEQTNSFNPPKKLISFNSLVKNNDGLLANHIVKSERIGYESAINYINFEVENWNAKLEEFGQFSIKNVGDFYLNSERKVVFEPFNQVNFLTSSFGLNSFISPEINRKTDDTTIVEENIQTTEYKHIEEDREIVSLPSEQNTTNFQYLKYAAILLISSGLGIAGANKLYNNNTNFAEQEYALNQKVQKQVDHKIQTATFFISNPLRKVVRTNVVQTPIIGTNLNYHIVAGSFKSQANAQKEADNLIKLGYKAKALKANKNGSFLVIYNSFANYDEAKRAEIEIEKSKNPDAWILTQEL